MTAKRDLAAKIERRSSAMNEAWNVHDLDAMMSMDAPDEAVKPALHCDIYSATAEGCSSINRALWCLWPESQVVQA